METHDVIVVGAGTSGCPLAARLAEDPTRSVLLVDAGAYHPSLESHPPELKYGSMFGASVPGHAANWDITATLRSGIDVPLPRGRVFGGCSALNGMIFTRGLPSDFDGWAAEGNEPWSFSSVLPYFKRLESDRDRKDEVHGQEGPVPVTRAQASAWTPVARAFAESCREAGFPEDPDMNHPESIGVGALPLNNLDGIRFNTALAYLPGAASRTNLTLRPETPVRRILLDGRRAIGIEVQEGDRLRRIHAGEVVLSAGAIKSPQLLLTSGIGPPAQLDALGIRVHHESPQVGRNFTDHCTLHLPVRIRGGRRLHPELTQTPLAQTGLHYTAPDSAEPSDMMLFQTVVSMNAAVLHGMPLSRRLGMVRSGLRQLGWRKMLDQARSEWDLTINIILMRGQSRGELELLSDDPLASPRLLYHYLEEPEDVRRLREGLRLATRLVESEPYRELGARRTILDDETLGSDPLLDEFMRANVTTSIHMASTCRMGPRPEDSVVDSTCRVHGVANLRVVDTSIMPTVVRRCPAATAVMIGERASAFFD